MKMISEFKGYRTCVEYDAGTKQFIGQRVADSFPAARELASEETEEESPVVVTGRKYAA